MFRSLLKTYTQLIKELSYSQMDQADTSSIDSRSDESEPALENACGQINIYFREDGEFAVSSNLVRMDQDVSDTTGTLLHMINSGHLAEYFVKSLKLWAEGEIEKENFAKEVIKEWKKIFYETNGNELNDIKGKNDLAIDPSDVFGLKRIE